MSVEFKVDTVFENQESIKKPCLEVKKKMETTLCRRIPYYIYQKNAQNYYLVNRMIFRYYIKNIHTLIKFIVFQLVNSELIFTLIRTLFQGAQLLIPSEGIKTA